MGIMFEHNVEESTGGSVEIGVEIKIGDIMRDMSSGEARELGSRVGDDGGDRDKRGA